MLVIGSYGVLLIVVALSLPKFALTLLILMIRHPVHSDSFLILQVGIIVITFVSWMIS
jgi:hypothetical protein